MLTLEEALSDKSQIGTFHLYELEVGGELYIGFTSQEPSARLAQHLESAREGSPFKVHKQLRKFGYYHSFTVIKTFQHEVEALLNEIIEIKKRGATLNKSKGGEGSKYQIIETKNTQGEAVFGVISYAELAKKKTDEKLRKLASQLDEQRRKKHDAYLESISNQKVFDAFKAELKDADLPTLLYTIQTHDRFDRFTCRDFILEQMFNPAETEFDREAYKEYFETLAERYNRELESPSATFSNWLADLKARQRLQIQTVRAVNPEEIITMSPTIAKTVEPLTRFILPRFEIPPPQAVPDLTKHHFYTSFCSSDSAFLRVLRPDPIPLTEGKARELIALNCRQIQDELLTDERPEAFVLFVVRYGDDSGYWLRSEFHDLYEIKRLTRPSSKKHNSETILDTEIIPAVERLNQTERKLNPTNIENLEEPPKSFLLRWPTYFLFLICLLVLSMNT